AARRGAGTTLDVGEIGFPVVAHDRALPPVECAATTVARGMLRPHRDADALLPRIAPRRRRRTARRGPPGIDVQAAAAGVARLHRQPLRPAAFQHVDEDLLHALLVEAGVLAERDQVAQQAGVVDARA